MVYLFHYKDIYIFSKRENHFRNHALRYRSMHANYDIKRQALITLGFAIILGNRYCRAAKLQSVLQSSGEGLCRPALLELLQDNSNFPPLGFMHVSKAGGSTVDWVLQRELVSRKSTSHILSLERNYATFTKNSPLIHMSTILRSPVSRFMSGKYFYMYDIRPRKSRRARRKDKVQMQEVGNTYTRFILNIPFGREGSLLMKKDKDTCEKAILKLRNRFAVVGTTERLLESLAVMSYSFKFIDFPVFGSQCSSRGSSSCGCK